MLKLLIIFIFLNVYDERNIREYFLLQNYLTNGSNARGILLKMSIDTLERINNDEWIHSFSAESKPTVRCFIQIDIISKIMMYLEVSSNILRVIL